MPGPAAEWRTDIDALRFVAGPGSACMVHRLAFRRLLGRTPRPADCLAYFTTYAPAFCAAAAAKIARDGLAPGRSFHLNSRDIARQVGRLAARDLQ
jgi:hypothetical protein